MHSSSPLRWSDLTGAAVGVWGIGVEGRATLERLKRLNVTPTALVEDDPTDDDVLPTASGGLDALGGCEIVIKSPGISRYSSEVLTLEGAGVAVVGGLGLWLEETGSANVIGITGTKGKSTTVSVAGHLARQLGRHCFVGGNLGMVPWAAAPADGVDCWIIEVSSYQALDLWSSPIVVGVTSLHADHLNWHGDAETYYMDKLSLCGHPGGVVTVANGDDELLAAHARLLGPRTRWIRNEDSDSSWTEPLGLRGAYNTRNGLIAAACLEEFGVAGADDPTVLRGAACDYQPLPHRLETIAVIDDVEFVDDSLSTNVLPTVAAIGVFGSRPLALLVGGFDRAIDYAPLGDYLASRDAPTLVLTMPQNGPRIHAALQRAGVQSVECDDISDAVIQAAAWAPRNGVVLLSPAAASYGIYPNYSARSRAFAEAVGNLRRT
jgi:UDP-N-acetylmuramoylalanine--D-glutamate ligase